MEYNTKGLNELSHKLHDFQIKAGFTDSNITQRLMLVHSEISEAFEAFRDDRSADISLYQKELNASNNFKNSFIIHIKDTLEDEIADSIIRLLAFCGENNIDIEKHIDLKMKFNELRGLKYGGKKF